MIYELRTSKLFPTKYYELYINVTNELHHLESYIEDNYKRLVVKSTEDDQDASAAEEWLTQIYEEVQYRPNIVPRLYLLVTVGSVRVKVNRDPTKQMEVLYDLVEMTKGVQHPTRGLFLRNYLSQVAREYLPDLDDPTEERNEAVKKAIEFVLINFGEMTRLWVRMQHQGAVRDRSRREKERLQLRMLVGTNLRRLSELQSVGLKVYKDQVLVKLTEQIVKCKDRIAQEYLMDCIIHVFTDEYHMATLDTFLSTCGKLHSSCSVKNIIEALMNRLSNFASESPAVFQKEDVFPKFQQYCGQIVAKPNKKMKLDDRLSLLCALVNFASQCYPDRDEYVAGVVANVYELLSKDGNEVSDEESVSHVKKILTAPLGSMQLRVLGIEEYMKLPAFLPLKDTRAVSGEVVRQLVDAQAELNTVEQIDALFGMIQTMIADSDGIKEEYDEKFEEEQNLMQLLICYITNEDVAMHFAVLRKAKTYFEKGGKERLKYTYPSLVYNAMGLINRVFAKEQAGETLKVKSKKIFQFIYSITGQYAPEAHVLGIRMFCNAAIAADKCNYNNIAYEFLTQAFLTYESEISESQEQFETVRIPAGTIQQCTHFEDENFETLRTKCTQHASKLLKRTCSPEPCCNVLISTG